MADGERYSIKHGAQGCLAAWVVALIGLVVADVIVQTLGWDYDRSKNTVALIVWPVAMCVGGYYACSKGRTTGWTNALVVGVLGEIIVMAAAVNSVEHLTFTQSIAYMVNHPSEYWQRLTLGVLTIPAALFGGYIWVKRSGTTAPRNDQRTA